MAILKSLLLFLPLLMVQGAFGGTPGADASGSPSAVRQAFQPDTSSMRQTTPESVSRESPSCANAQEKAAAGTAKSKPKFELKDRDRVVFLGNTLIERAQKYGYWETMLTARYPNRKIIFRNLGWDGDTVWAESRGIFDTPEKGYARMLQRVGGIKPTMIFVGYGNNEAFAGKPGLPRFVKQYNKLLDDLTKVSAKGVRFVLLSPLRYEQWKGRLQNAKKLNQRLAEYSDAIHVIAKKRNGHFVDLMTYFGNMPPLTGADGQGSAEFMVPITDNGRHLNEFGYKTSASAIREQLCPLPPRPLVIFDNKGIVTKSVGPIPEGELINGGLRFEVREKRVLLGHDFMDERVIRAPDLPQGRYSLKVDGVPLLNITVSKKRNFGVTVSDLNAEKLRQAIIAKNRLYFHSWRPQNITYLFLFRKHEQGNNAKEVKEFLKLVAEKEQEIDRLKKPVTRTYELVRAKNAKQ